MTEKIRLLKGCMRKMIDDVARKKKIRLFRTNATLGVLVCEEFLTGND